MKRSPKILLNLLGIVALSIIAYFFGQGKSEPKTEKEDVKARKIAHTAAARERAIRDVSAGRSDAERSLQLLDRLNQCTTNEDFQAELAAIQMTSDKSEVARHLGLLFEAWLKIDAQGALSEVNKIQSIRHNFGRVSGVFLQWAQQNPDEAEVLLQKTLNGSQLKSGKSTPFLDGIDPPNFLLSMVVGLGSQSPERAASLLESMAASRVQTSAIEVFVQNWLPQQPQEAMNWATKIEDQGTRELAIGVVSENLGMQGMIKEGLTWALSLEDSGNRDNAAKSLAGQWAQRDPAAAYDWFAELPDEGSQLMIMPELIQNVMLDRGDEVEAWIKNQEPSADLDPSSIAYTIMLANSSPAHALSEVQIIHDPDQREATYHFIIDRWNQRDPIALRNYLSEVVDLPENLQYYLKDN